MIKVTIELFPAWDDKPTRTLSVLKIWNDGSGTGLEGNYRFKSLEGPEIRGSIKGFPRTRQNVLQLLKLCLSAAEGRRPKNHSRYSDDRI